MEDVVVLAFNDFLEPADSLIHGELLSLAALPAWL
jgi:hypothetical protein